MKRIAVVGTSNTLNPERARQVIEVAGGIYPEGALEIVFHPQCFTSAGHFAGTDEARSSAFLEMANDPAFDAIWFARGGYGAGRLLESVIPNLNQAARHKTYMGYSDATASLAALYSHGIGRPVWGPMPVDVGRKEVGPFVIEQALRFLVDNDHTYIDPAVRETNAPIIAANLTVWCGIMGTKWEPQVEGHVLFLEDVGEQMYRIDRMMFQLTARLKMLKIKGIRVGNFTDIEANTPDFGMTLNEVMAYWSKRSGIPILGSSMIGHVATNRIVPWGRYRG